MLGVWDARLYRQGFRNALDDIIDEGWDYADRHATNMPDEGWYVTGYRTAVNAYKEGLPR